MWGALSDERTDLTVTNAAAPQSFFGPSLAGIITRFYCLRFETPQPGGSGPRIYIPQEQSGPVIPPGTGSPILHRLQLQGYGGGIRTRLHTGFNNNWYLSQLYSLRTDHIGDNASNSLLLLQGADRIQNPLLRVLSLPDKQNVHRAVP
jgi:hypothetical protein